MKVDSIKLLSILFGGQKEFKATMATCGVDTDTVAEQYDPTKTYHSGDLVIYNDVLYIATADTTGTFDPTKWTEINIATILKDIEERLRNLSTLGRYLAVWDCTTGLPTTNPTTLPYDYHSGDYFIIGAVGTTNYMPSGTQYTGAASTTVDAGTPHVLDMYRYDGTSWSWLDFGEEFRTILQNYYTKDQIDAFLNAKQDTISDLVDIRLGAGKGLTSIQYVLQSLTEEQKRIARENIGIDLKNIIIANVITNQSITLSQIKAILNTINTNHEHVFFDVSALGAAMYLCTIYIDNEKYKIFDLVSGRFTEGAYVDDKLLTTCLVAAESIATQSQIDHLQDEINELGGSEKIKTWEGLGDAIESGESAALISAGDTIDINWVKSVTAITTHGLTVTCNDRWKFAKGVGECEAKDYYLVYNGTAWTYNETEIDLAAWGLSVSGTVQTGEVMVATMQIDVTNHTFTSYDDFTPVNTAVPHNWCLEQTYAPTTKAYDTYEAVFTLAAGKTLPAGNYKLNAPYYGTSPLIDIYFTIPQDFTATDGLLQFASTGYQNVACIPGSETKYYIASAIRPVYKNSNSYIASSITVEYNQTGDWADISAIDGVTVTSAHIQAGLGNNCPAYCNLRQWLNDDSQNGHYEATHDFDRPATYNFQAGYLYGIDPRVLALIQPCKTKFTAGYNNGEYERNTTYEIEDKVFLLSMKEMSFNIQTSEGNATDLYSEYTDGALTNDAVAARAKYNKAGGTLNNYRWSRSASSSSANYARSVTSSGSYNSTNAIYSLYFAPAFIIGKASENL